MESKTDEVQHTDSGESKDDLKETIDDENNPNILKVLFRKPQAKDIVSPHSFSILAKEDPVVPLSGDMAKLFQVNFSKLIAAQKAAVAAAEEAALAAQNQKPGKAPPKGKNAPPEPEPVPEAPKPIVNDVNKIHKSRLPELLKESGFSRSLEAIKVAVERLYHGVDDLDEKEFIAFVQVFYAPSFYFGQRLRRYVDRGQLNDAVSLIARGCSVNTADGEGLNSFHYAAEFNKIDLVRALREVAGDSIIVDAKDKQGWTPLFTASHHGNTECVALFLEMGASVEAKNINGKTPLHAAAARGRTAICNLLLEAGASLSVTDNHHMTPLHDAAFKGNFETFEALRLTETANLELRDKLGNRAEDYLADFAAEAKMAQARALQHQGNGVCGPGPEVTFAPNTSIASSKQVHQQASTISEGKSQRAITKTTKPPKQSK